MRPTYLEYPNVPAYPGVPQLLRPIDAAIAAVPELAIGIGALTGILGSALQQTPRWGIFDIAGNQLGATDTSTIRAVSGALLGELTGSAAPVLSTFGFDFMKETRVADFPLEGGSFASYNKVELPANPVVTLALSGSESDRTNFLNAIEAACRSTDLYLVITPEVAYVDYTIERYTYARRAQRGATLLIVEISLKEVREVQATFAQVATPIVSPQNAAATPQVSNGMTQPTTPDVSTLRSLANKLGIN